jgi:hypothetical protein
VLQSICRCSLLFVRFTQHSQKSNKSFQLRITKQLYSYTFLHDPPTPTSYYSQICPPFSPCKSSTLSSLLFTAHHRNLAAAPALISRTPSFPRSTFSQLKILRCDLFCAPSAANLLCDTGGHHHLLPRQLGVSKASMQCHMLAFLLIRDEDEPSPNAGETEIYCDERLSRLQASDVTKIQYQLSTKYSSCVRQLPGIS